MENGSATAVGAPIRGRHGCLGTVSQIRSAHRAPGPGATTSSTRNAVRSAANPAAFLARTIVLFFADDEPMGRPLSAVGIDQPGEGVTRPLLGLGITEQVMRLEVDQHDPVQVLCELLRIGALGEEALGDPGPEHL